MTSTLERVARAICEELSKNMEETTAIDRAAQATISALGIIILDADEKPQQAKSHCGWLGVFHVPGNSAVRHVIATYSKEGWRFVESWEKVPDEYELLRIIEINGKPVVIK